MVDWSLARRVAGLAAGSAPVPRLARPLEPLVADAVGEVARYTGLEPEGPLPAPELLDRADWSAANLTTMASLLDPVVARVEGRLGDKAGPLSGPIKAVTSTAVAAEAGLVVGYMSQRVLGQYELSLIQPELAPRLLFVGPNLRKAVEEMEVDEASFLAWVALHEVTHVIQFGAVGWLRGHLGDLLQRYLATVDVRLAGSAGGLLSLPDPARLVQAFREGGLMALVQSEEQRGLMDRIQATMALVEGYSEHVMDAVGEHVLPAYAGMREAMERRRRSRSAPERALQRLLGFDLKLRQYQLGKSFCDAVVAGHGIACLNRAWSSAAALPTLDELERPEDWVARERAAQAA